MEIARNSSDLVGQKRCHGMIQPQIVSKSAQIMTEQDIDFDEQLLVKSDLNEPS